MKKIGIVLLCLQVLSLLGGIANGSILGMLALGGTRGIGNLIGFFIPGILGVLLIIKSKKNTNK